MPSSKFTKYKVLRFFVFLLCLTQWYACRPREISEPQRTGFTKRPTILLGHCDGVLELKQSPDHQFLASAGADRSIRFWSLANRQLVRILEIPSEPTAIEWSPDGKWFAVADKTYLVSVYHVPTFVKALELKGHEDEVKCLAFSPEGQKLLTGGKDAIMRIWQLPQGELTRIGILDRFPTVAEIEQMPFEESKMFFNDRMLSINGLLSAVFSEDGHYLTTFHTGFYRYWDLNTSFVLSKIKFPRPFSHGGRLSHDGEYGAGITKFGKMQIYRRDITEPINEGYRIINLAFNPSAEVLATIGFGILKLFSTCESEILNWQSKIVANCIDWTDDGENFIIGDGEGHIKFVSTFTFKETERFKGADITTCDSVAVDSKGRYVVAALRKLARPFYLFWNVEKRTVIPILEYDTVWDIAVDPLDRYLVVLKSDRYSHKIELRSLETGQIITDWYISPPKSKETQSSDGFKLHTQLERTDDPPCLFMSFSADGNTIIAYSSPVVRVFSFPDGREKTHVNYFSNTVLHASLSPDGRRAMVVEAKQVTFWDLEKTMALQRYPIEFGSLLFTRFRQDNETALFRSFDTLEVYNWKQKKLTRIIGEKREHIGETYYTQFVRNFGTAEQIANAPDLNIVYTTSFDEFSAWNLKKNERIHNIPILQNVQYAAIARRAGLAVAGYNSGKVEIYNLAEERLQYELVPINIEENIILEDDQVVSATKGAARYLAFSEELSLKPYPLTAVLRDKIVAKGK